MTTFTAIFQYLRFFANSPRAAVLGEGGSTVWCVQYWAIWAVFDLMWFFVFDVLWYRTRLDFDFDLKIKYVLFIADDDLDTGLLKASVIILYFNIISFISFITNSLNVLHLYQNSDQPLNFKDARANEQADKLRDKLRERQLGNCHPPHHLLGKLISQSEVLFRNFAIYLGTV